MPDVKPEALAADGTYPMPEGGWVCFHCGERFTKPGTARDHFGETPSKGAHAQCLDAAGLDVSRVDYDSIVMTLERTERERDEAHREVALLQALVKRANDVLEPYIELTNRVEEQQERRAAAQQVGEGTE